MSTSRPPVCRGSTGSRAFSGTSPNNDSGAVFFAPFQSYAMLWRTISLVTIKTSSRSSGPPPPPTFLLKSNVPKFNSLRYTLFDGDH